MAQFAQMARGAAGVGSDKRNPPPKGDFESEMVMRSAPHPRADPRSPEYDGSRCFRSRNPGLGLFLFSKKPVQVGAELLPAEFHNLKFEGVGGDYGELFVAADDPLFADKVARICGGVGAEGAIGPGKKKYKPHHFFTAGVIVDAVAAHAEVKKYKALEIIAALADPDIKAEVEAELGAETVTSFLAAAVNVPKPDKAKKPQPARTN